MPIRASCCRTVGRSAAIRPPSDIDAGAEDSAATNRRTAVRRKNVIQEATDDQSISEQINERGVTEDNFFTTAVGKLIKIKPHKGNGNLKYEFRARYSQTLPATYINTFTMAGLHIPTKNIIITAKYPNGFLFNASGKLTNKDRRDDKRVLLDGEHISIGWTKV